MPTVSIQGKTLSREHSLKYLGITFDRSLSFNLHVTHIVNRARKGLVAVKTMAAAKMPQHILLVLYKSLVLSFIDYMDWVFSHCQQPSFKDLMSYKMKA